MTTKRKTFSSVRRDALREHSGDGAKGAYENAFLLGQRAWVSEGHKYRPLLQNWKE